MESDKYLAHLTLRQTTLKTTNFKVAQLNPSSRKPRMKGYFGVQGMLKLLVTLLLCYSHIAHVKSLHVNNTSDASLVSALSSIRSALNYLDDNHRMVNLDTVIGTRILEGQFKVLLEHLDRKSNELKIRPDILEEIFALQVFANDVSRKSIPYITVMDNKYYKKIGMMLKEGFWELDYPSRYFHSSVRLWPFREGEVLQEEQSDNCIAEFFGTGKRTRRKCVISQKCWNLLTAPGYNGYSLSHEVFYLQIGEMFGCHSQMKAMQRLHRQRSIDQLEADFCANMFQEAKLIAQTGYPEHKQDLFMEQAVLCGMLGYKEFFNSDWLQKILSWQDSETGCYKGIPVRESEIEYRPEVVHRRIKREERLLGNGCMCHRTTVALAVLGQYVRYILEYENALSQVISAKQ